MKIKVVLEPSEEGGYTTYVPSLPGCISEGDTKEEALANVREAIALFWSLSRMTKYLPNLEYHRSRAYASQALDLQGNPEAG